MDIELASLWEYVGEHQPHCRGVVHCVISNDDDGVITWSEGLNFKRKTTKRAGDTWMSDKEEFLLNFKPAVSGKPFSFA